MNRKNTFPKFAFYFHTGIDMQDATTNLNNLVISKRNRTHPLEWQVALAVLREATRLHKVAEKLITDS